MDHAAPPDEQTRYYIYTSPEIEKALADNETDLVELLQQQEGFAVSKAYGANPLASPDSAHRDPVTIILASSLLTVALSNAIVRVINSLTNRKIAVKELDPATIIKSDTTVKFLGLEYTSQEH